MDFEELAVWLRKERRKSEEISTIYESLGDYTRYSKEETSGEWTRDR